MGRQEERIYTGKAVVNGKFRFLSVSQVKLFDPLSEGCNRKWAYQYLFGLKLAKTGSVKDGQVFAEKLEHYLKYNEDVLPPVLAAAKFLFPRPGPDLEVEKPLGPDFPMAVFLRDQLLKPEFEHREDIKAAIKHYAGLVIRDIPLDGAPDVGYFRDVYISDEGLPVQEIAGYRVKKIEDLKTTSRIWPQKVHSGINAGQILPGYAKTAAQVCDDTQMLGYAKCDIDKGVDATHFRLGHIYAQTRSRGATKRSGIISREEVLRRFQRVEGVVDKMIQVATAQKIEDIEPSPASCDAYTHLVPCGAPRCGAEGAYPGFTRNPTNGEFEPCFVCKGKAKTAKGCGHRYYCPLSNSQIVPHMISPFKESTTMSLIDQINKPTAPAPVIPTVPVAPPAPPPPSQDAQRAAVEAEKQRLRAQAANRLPPKAGMTISKMGCGAPGCGDGCEAGFVRMSPGSVTACSKCGGRGVAVYVADMSATPPMPPAPPPQPNSIVPPDAPPMPSLLKGADPVPLEERMQVTDPALRQTIEEHAQQHSALAAQTQAEKGGSVWCSESGTTIKLTMEMALKKKYVCSCTKQHSTKTATRQGDDYIFTVPRHKPKNKPADEPTEDDEIEATEPLVAPQPPAPPPPPAQMTFLPPPPPPLPPPAPAPVVVAPPPPPLPVAVAPPPPPAQVAPAAPEAPKKPISWLSSKNGNGATNGNGHGAIDVVTPEMIAADLEGAVGYLNKVIARLRGI